MTVSEYLTDLVDHKRRVATHMQHASSDLLKRVVELGDILPYNLETDEPITLMFMIDVTCKIKRDQWSAARFQLSSQVSGIVQNTIAYLDVCEPGSSPCHWIAHCIDDLFLRAAVHDNSKFSSEEYDAYEEAFPGLQRYAYGSAEFKAELAKIQPALQHHYQANDHHPEHFPGGISQMNWVQLIEMSADWKAASERSKTEILPGLEMNRKRFGIDDQLTIILRDTLEWYEARSLL